MKWSIQREVDGVITDDPKKYLDVCKNYDQSALVHRVALTEYASIAWINLFLGLFSLLFRYRYGSKVESGKLSKERRSLGMVRLPA